MLYSSTVSVSLPTRKYPPMNHLLFPLLTLLIQWLRPSYNARLRFLEAQIRVLRSRIDATRIVPTPEERNELLRLGDSIEHDISEILHVVQPKTYRRWLRERQRHVSFKASGRPRTPQALKHLIIRGRVRCKQQLGGIITSYYREAA